ncbi:MAG: aldo/keto reductase [Mesorhizobium sp.]|uniref:aldo/keto reductase n=1 Tax=Mesorhizobium sp. TaxID=1871066 RepID=UPI000FE4BE45|nr:aldo/keto reductase [Mesorhizobium sp.]RWP83509.1 MAG: aldo/keto reductase [Mesorhizobium sp.]
MTDITAAMGGTFRIGGEIEINRLGFGANRIAGHGVWGKPTDHAEAIRSLKRLPELGVNFIDTADCYGPNVSEQLIRETLHPYCSTVVATKGGLVRPGPDQWEPNGRPEYLIAQAKGSQKRLGVNQIALWQLHRIDSKVPQDEQFEAVKSLLDEGVIRCAGLSEVTIEQVKAAQKFFKVATVQNRYNLADRSGEDVLNFCAAHDIGFIPWLPLADGRLIRPGGLLEKVAKRHQATTGQIALAWLLQRSPIMLPIPGTSKVAHLEENVAAASIRLAEDEFELLQAA